MGWGWQTECARRSGRESRVRVGLSRRHEEIHYVRRRDDAAHFGAAMVVVVDSRRTLRTGWKLDPFLKHISTFASSLLSTIA